MLDEIIAVAQGLAGALSAQEQELLASLCGAAEAELASCLKDGIAPEDCSAAFVCGAAYIALSNLYAAVGGGFSSFSAGDMSVRRDSGSQSRELREKGELIMAPYSRDGAFSFEGVL